MFLWQRFQFINIIEPEFVSLDINGWWLRVTQINLLAGAGSSHVELVFRDLIARTVFPRDGEWAIHMAVLVTLEQVVLRDHAVLRTGLRDTPL